MPNRKRVRRFGSAAIVAALALAACSPVASANHNSDYGSGSPTVGCASAPVRQAFAAFGDLNWYYLAPGGDFESGLSWSTSGWAGLVPYSSSLGLTGWIGDSSLALGRYGEAISPPFCVNSERPHVRLTALSFSSRDDRDLAVTVRLHDADGDIVDHSERVLDPDDHRSWRPSRYIYLRTDELAPGETAMVDLRIRSRGDWRIDDVFIDPYRRG